MIHPRLGKLRDGGLRIFVGELSRTISAEEAMEVRSINERILDLVEEMHKELTEKD